MRKPLATLALMALVVVPFVAAGQDITPADDQLQQGVMEDRAGDSLQDRVQDQDSGTITAEVVGIDGDRLLAETDNGERLVFLIEGSADRFNVGDELELKFDEEADTVVILHVVPEDRES